LFALRGGFLLETRHLRGKFIASGRGGRKLLLSGGELTGQGGGVAGGTKLVLARIEKLLELFDLLNGESMSTRERK
jgi:hypothetical protein